MFPWQHKSAELNAWEIRCDEFLKDIGAVEFNSLKQLISELTIVSRKGIDIDIKPEEM